MLKEALCGGYVNFGVFRLYGDDALDKALNMFVKLLMSIPLKTLLVRCGTDLVVRYGTRASVRIITLILW